MAADWVAVNVSGDGSGGGRLSGGGGSENWLMAIAVEAELAVCSFTLGSSAAELVFGELLVVMYIFISCSNFWVRA